MGINDLLGVLLSFFLSDRKIFRRLFMYFQTQRFQLF